MISILHNLPIELLCLVYRNLNKEDRKNLFLFSKEYMNIHKKCLKILGIVLVVKNPPPIYTQPDPESLFASLPEIIEKRPTCVKLYFDYIEPGALPERYKLVKYTKFILVIIHRRCVGCNLAIGKESIGYKYCVDCYSPYGLCRRCKNPIDFNRDNWFVTGDYEDLCYLCNIKFRR